MENKDSKTKPQILAKSQMMTRRAKRKMYLGADALEIQLLNELAPDENGKSPSLEEAFSDLDEMLEMPIESIHASLGGYAKYKQEISPNLEILLQPSFRQMFDNVCDLAELAGEKQGHQVRVVVHTEMNTTRMTGVLKWTFDETFEEIRQILLTRPRINLCIENVTPIEIQKDGTFGVMNGFGYDNVNMVREFRSRYPELSDRIYTVLDTCHCEVTKKITGLVSMYDETIAGIEYSLESFFKANKDVCDLIHMSKTINNGNGKGRHGQPFNATKEDAEIIAYYKYIYDKYEYTCPIVLEVAETDYDLSTGFESSIKALKKVLENDI